MSDNQYLRKSRKWSSNNLDYFSLDLSFTVDKSLRVKPALCEFSDLFVKVEKFHITEFEIIKLKARLQSRNSERSEHEEQIKRTKTRRTREQAEGQEQERQKQEGEEQQKQEHEEQIKEQEQDQDKSKKE